MNEFLRFSLFCVGSYLLGLIPLAGVGFFTVYATMPWIVVWTFIVGGVWGLAAATFAVYAALGGK